MRKIKLLRDGGTKTVTVEKINGRLWFHMDGETFVYGPDAGRSDRRGSAALNPNLIESPMPGKILRMEVKPGDQVKTGQILVVMEAMKMEYSLAAAQSATVTEVVAKVGEQVRLGQTLVRLKGASDAG